MFDKEGTSNARQVSCHGSNQSLLCSSFRPTRTHVGVDQIERRQLSILEDNNGTCTHGEEETQIC